MSDLVFAINGELHRVNNPNPGERLLDFLRRETPYTGSKYGCGEGGCGACAVLVQRSADSVPRTVNSCLAAVCSLHGASITTTEGLGGSQHPKGFHPVQKRVADFNGSQCGFCTPGMVMAMYGAIEARGGAPSTKDMESCLDGNLCRCTGYRPLLDSAKSLAANPTVVVTDKVGMDGAKAQTGPLSAEEFKARRPVFPSALADATAQADAGIAAGGKPTPRWSGGGRQWFYPRTVQALLDTVAQALNGTSAGDPLHSRFKLVGGNTSAGVYKAAVSDPSILISLGGVPALSAIENTDDGVRFGAATTINNAIAALENSAKETPAQTKHFEGIIDVMSNIAGAHVRGLGTLAGNIMMARQWGFESDLVTGLMGAGATLDVAQVSDTAVSDPTTMTLEKFFAIPATVQTVITAVTVPWSDATEVFRFYKSALRPQNSHSLVNAGFRVKAGDDGKITAATLVYGAVGTPHAVHASGAEKFMIGRTLKGIATCKTTSDKLFGLLKSELPIPSLGTDKADATHRVAHRRRLVTAFMTKFLAEPVAPAAGANTVVAAPGGYTRQVSVGKHTIPGFDDSGKSLDDDFYTNAPISLPVPKLSARLQASGEARYTCDGPLGHRTAYAALGQAYEVGRVIDAVNTAKAAAAPGVIRVLTATDIRGANNQSAFYPERLLAEVGGAGITFAGEPVCVVVAHTKREANEAAKLVTVSYRADPDAKQLPATLRDAIKTKAIMSYNPATDHYERHDNEFANLTDALAACENVVSGEVNYGEQKHFPMECHSAVAAPDEGGRMTVWSANQCLDFAQTAVANVLYGPGEDKSRVTINCRRVGGAFGGKITRNLAAACAAALGAQACKRPVVMEVTRAQDMEMTGGRHDTLATYDVGYDKSGRIQALRITAHMDGGCSPDISFFCTMTMARGVDQCYYIPEMEASAKVYFTATSSRTAVRGPSEPEASFIIETVITHVANMCGLAPETVREQNMLGVGVDWPQDKAFAILNGQKVEPSCWTIPRMWPELKRTSDFDARRKAIQEFNKTSPNIKRGIAMTTLKYEVGAHMQQANVSILPDGSIQVVHSGSESGQGIHTKVAQAVAYGLGKILEDDKPPAAAAAAAPDAAAAAPAAASAASGPKGLLDIYPEAVGLAKTGPLLRHVMVTDASSAKLANGSFTGGSTTSECCMTAALLACEELVNRLQPVKQSILDKKKAENEKKEEKDRVPVTASWREMAGAASGPFVGTVGLSVTRQTPLTMLGSHKYCLFGVGCSEVEIDRLTGESKIRRTDILYDAGKPLNAAVDLGQVEGAFMMGVGNMLREQIIRNEHGEAKTKAVLWNNGTWEYKLPCSFDAPEDLRVGFLSKARHPRFTFSSKATGEPPLVLAVSVIMAVRDAIASTRAASGDSKFFELPAPAMVDDIAGLMDC